MADQVERLGLILNLAEQGTDIVNRYANDPVEAGAIQTGSGPIKNLKQVSADIKSGGEAAIDVAVTELIDTLKTDTSVSALIDGLTDTATLAEESAARSESAVSLAAAFSNPYPNTTDGVANTSGTGATNRFFSVHGTGSTLATAYRNDVGVATVIGQAPSVVAVSELSDRLESRLTIESAPGLPIVERDSTGRMSRFVDEAGHTFIKFHESVQVPAANLDPSVMSRMLPSSYQFLSTGKYPFALIDMPSGRLSEFVLEETGRFPAWVAKALVARGGGTSSAFGGVALGEAYVDATQLPNGATIPMDTAQASTSFGIAPLYVSGGLIVHDAVRADNNAGYLEVALLKTASRIGAAYSFPVGAGGAITLVLPKTSWASSPGGTPAGIHFVLNYNGSWNCSFLNISESFYASGNIGNQADGVMRFVDVSVSGNDVSIHLPDGTTVHFTDARVSANISNLVIWELYEFAAQTIRPRFHALWGGSNGVHATLTDTRPMAGMVVAFIKSENAA